MKRILMIAGLLLLVQTGWTIEKQYLVVLSEAPVAKASNGQLKSKAAQAQRQLVNRQQNKVTENIQTRLKGRVGRTMDTVLNAMVVTIDESRLAELQTLPGILRVEEEKIYTLQLNESNRVSNVLMMQQRLGLNRENMGAGLKIAILDTGIQVPHPSFDDAGYTYPAGFDPGPDNEAAYTNNKVIVAKNFASDPTAQDLYGHGTAAASCAAGRSVEVGSGDNAMNVEGAAPGAYLGNYKVFSTLVLPDNNTPSTSSFFVLPGIEAAVEDGMDILNLSLGGTITGDAASDSQVQALQNAVASGCIVCVSAGNEGYVYDPEAPDIWVTYDLNEESVGSPGNAPSVITVGASENRRRFTSGGTAYVENGETPAELESFVYGTDNAVSETLGEFGMYELVDITDYGVGEEGCSPFGGGVDLSGKIALIKRGSCSFCTKIYHAEQAGAIGAVVYNLLYEGETNEAEQTGGILNMDVTGSGCEAYPTTIPGYFLRLEEGEMLKALLDDGKTVMIGFGMLTSTTANVGFVSQFSSTGPTKYDFFLKPDVAAVGNQLTVATQNNRSLTDMATGAERTMYDASGYSMNISGTSFSTPYVAGCAAALWHLHPELTPAEIKSLLATTGTFTYNYHQTQIGWDYVNTHEGVAAPTRQGGGIVDMDRAMNARVVMSPSNIGFQKLDVSGTDPQTETRQLSLKNISDETVRLMPYNLPICANERAYLDFSGAMIEIAPGATATLDLTAHYQGPVFTDLQGYVEFRDNFGNCYQVAYFGRFNTNTVGYPSSSDTDGDGLTKSQEDFMGTDLFRSDTDGDGTPDLEELSDTETDPTNATSNGIAMPMANLYYLPFSSVEYNNSQEHRTDVFIGNTSGDDATIRLYVVDKNGDLMSAPRDMALEGNGWIQVPIGPGIVPSMIGWVAVTSDRELAVAGDVRVVAGDGTTLYSFGIPATETLASMLYVPHVAERTNQWTTNIGVANAGLMTPTSVEATFTPQGGTAATIPDFGGVATSNYVDVINGIYSGTYPFDSSESNHWWGTVETSGGVSKSAVLVGMESFTQIREERQMFQSAGLLLNGEASTEIVIPHVTTRWLWWTGIALNNPNETAASVTMTPYDADGTALTPTSFSLASGAKMVRLVESFWTEQSLAYSEDTAWIQVTSDLPITGYELFGIDSSGDASDNKDALAGVEALIHSSTTLRFVRTPKANDWTWAGIVLLNTGQGNTSLDIRAYNALGQEVGQKYDSLLPGQKIVEVVDDDLFGTLGNDVCWIEVTSSQPIFGFELYGGQDFLFLSGIPAL